jgi:hypothetical protein
VTVRKARDLAVGDHLVITRGPWVAPQPASGMMPAVPGYYQADGYVGAVGSVVGVCLPFLAMEWSYVPGHTSSDRRRSLLDMRHGVRWIPADPDFVEALRLPESSSNTGEGPWPSIRSEPYDTLEDDLDD